MARKPSQPEENYTVIWRFEEIHYHENVTSQKAAFAMADRLHLAAWVIVIREETGAVLYSRG